MKVTEFEPGKKMVIESDEGFKPRFEIHLEPRQGKQGVKGRSSEFDNGSDLTLRLSLRRRAALFQMLVGPSLSFLGGHQLRRSLFVLRMMIP